MAEIDYEKLAEAMYRIERELLRSAEALAL